MSILTIETFHDRQDDGLCKSLIDHICLGGARKNMVWRRERERGGGEGEGEGEREGERERGERDEE